MSSCQRAWIHYFIFTWRWIHIIVIWIHSTVKYDIPFLSTICHAYFIVSILKFCESSYERAFKLHLDLVFCGCRHIFSWYLNCTAFFLVVVICSQTKNKVLHLIRRKKFLDETRPISGLMPLALWLILFS